MKSDIFDSKDSLLRAVDEMFDDSRDVSRQIQERIIWRNLLYYCGEQYIEYMRSSGTFRRRQVPDFMPTPVSNEIREYVRSVKAMLLNQKRIPRIWPNTNEREDIEAATLGESVLIWLDAINDGQIEDEKEKVIIWLCLSGTAFMRTYPDVDGGLWLPDSSSKTGSVGCESILPFNVRVDSMGDSLEKKRWVGVQSLKPKEWVEDTFQVKISAEGNQKTYIDYQKKLSKLVGSVSPWKGHALDMQTIETDDDDLVLFKEVEFRPSAKFPQGKYVVSCGGQIVHQADRLPIAAGPGQWAYTITDFHYNYVPGRFWSDAGVNDLISPQNIINEIDQALSINRKGVGRPRIVAPGEVGLKKMDLPGHGFLALTFNPIMGQKPEIHEGTPLPQQVLEERRFQKEQMQDTAGDPKNILRGQPPSAQSSGIQVDILRETAQQSKQPDSERFNRSMTRVYKKRLLVAQEVFTEEQVIKIAGRGNRIQTKKFKAADLRGNTDVRLEVDSGLIATKSGQTQVLLNMIQAGMFQEGQINPSLREEIMRRFGMASFTDEIDIDVERAEKENVAVMSGEIPVMTAEIGEGEEQIIVTDDPLFKYDNHAKHYEIHRKFVVSPEFIEMPTQAQTILMAHTDLHHQLMIEEQQAMMAQQLAMEGGGDAVQAQGSKGRGEGGKPESPARLQ